MAQTQQARYLAAFLLAQWDASTTPRERMVLEALSRAVQQLDDAAVTGGQVSALMGCVTGMAPSGDHARPRHEPPPFLDSAGRRAFHSTFGRPPAVMSKPERDAIRRAQQMGFCACGRRQDECDGSRLGCRKPASARGAR